MSVYGIDLGSVYSSIAKMNKAGIPEVIYDNWDARSDIPSAVLITRDHEIIVGEDAREEIGIAPEPPALFFTRWIGLDRAEHPEMKHYAFCGKEYSPVELSAMVLKRIVHYAEEAGEEVRDVVITCPACFDPAQRDAVRQAGELAGLNVLAVVCAPLAIAVKYFSRFPDEDHMVLVYDLGGSAFDVTLLKYSAADGQKKVEIVNTDGSNFLGGTDWDERLYDILLQKCEEYCRAEGRALEEEEKVGLRRTVEGAKMSLSYKKTVFARTEAFGKLLKLEVTREEFEAATADLVDKTFSMLNSVIADSGMSVDKIDRILMTGGGVIMPMIRNRMYEWFDEKTILFEPQQAVVMGAAMLADSYANN